MQLYKTLYLHDVLVNVTYKLLFYTCEPKPVHP